MRALFIAAAGISLACSSADATPSAEFPRDAYAVVTSDDGLRVEVRTSPTQPPPRGTCTVLLTITDASGPRDGLSLAVVPWMPSHGHGASVMPIVSPSRDGKYVVTDVDLFMPGRWELRTSISGAENDHAVAQIDVP